MNPDNTTGGAGQDENRDVDRAPSGESNWGGKGSGGKGKERKSGGKGSEDITGAGGSLNTDIVYGGKKGVYYSSGSGEVHQTTGGHRSTVGKLSTATYVYSLWF